MRIKRQFLSNVLGVIVIVWSFIQSVHILSRLVGYKITDNGFALTSSRWVCVLAMFLFWFDTIAGFAISLCQISKCCPDWDKIMRSILEHVIDFDVTPKKTETKSKQKPETNPRRKKSEAEQPSPQPAYTNPYYTPLPYSSYWLVQSCNPSVAAIRQGYVPPNATLTSMWPQNQMNYTTWQQLMNYTDWQQLMNSQTYANQATMQQDERIIQNMKETICDGPFSAARMKYAEQMWEKETGQHISQT